MGSARGLYRLQLGLGLGALLGVALIAAVTLRNLSFVAVSWSEFVEMCQSVLLAGFRPSAFLAVTLGLLSVLVLWRGTRSTVRRVRATRQFERSLIVVGALPGAPAIRVLRDDVPRAFCAGLLRPRVFVSDTAVARLTPVELAAVLAHERHHAAQRDPLRLLAAAVVADAVFFLPGFGHLRERYATVAELAADDAAVDAPGGRAALASAMLLFGETPHGSVVGVSDERVDHLVDGAPLRWRLRASILLTTLTAIGLLYVAAAVIGGAAPGTIEATGLLTQLCLVYLLAFAGIAGRGVLRGATRGVRRARLG